MSSDRTPQGDSHRLGAEKQVAVIGAGPCGLAACRWLKLSGWDYTAFELQPEIGGVWQIDGPRGRVYAGTYMISSKRLTEFSDFPMPRGFPHYPHHRQVLAYLKDYVVHHALSSKIRCSVRIQRIIPDSDGFEVEMADGTKHRFGAVILAVGHHSHPVRPEWGSSLTIPSWHSSEVKDTRAFSGKRVLVVGGGNSGCDLAVELSHTAARVTLSLRRGYHVLPKYLFGAPLDRCGETLDRWHLPRIIKRQIVRWLLRAVAGPPERYGLPRPDHEIFESHPIINSLLPIYVGHHRIDVRPDVVRAEASRIEFADGSTEDFDTVVLATGYKLSFPFFDDQLALEFGERRAHATIAKSSDGRIAGTATDGPSLFLEAFHPQINNLFVVGQFQPTGGIWRLAELQARLISQFLRAQISAPQVAQWFRRMARENRGKKVYRRGRYIASDRHAIEVDYFDFRRELRRWDRELARRLRLVNEI